jgi:hypothetical protein
MTELIIYRALACPEPVEGLARTELIIYRALACPEPVEGLDMTTHPRHCEADRPWQSMVDSLGCRALACPEPVEGLDMTELVICGAIA